MDRLFLTDQQGMVAELIGSEGIVVERTGAEWIVVDRKAMEGRGFFSRTQTMNTMIDEIKKLARDKAREILREREEQRLAKEQADRIYYEEQRGMLASLVRSLIPIRPFPEDLLFIHESAFQEWILSAEDRSATVWAGLKMPNGNMVVTKFVGMGDGWKRQTDYWASICTNINGMKVTICNHEFWIALDRAANG